MIGLLPYRAFQDAGQENIRATEPTPSVAGEQEQAQRAVVDMEFFLGEGDKPGFQLKATPKTRHQGRKAPRREPCLPARSAVSKRSTRRAHARTAGGQDLAACRRDFAEPLCVGVMLDDEDANVLEFGDSMRQPAAPSFSLAARTTLFSLAASSASLEGGVRQFVRADAGCGRNRAGPDDAEVDVHPRDAQSRLGASTHPRP